MAKRSSSAGSVKTRTFEALLSGYSSDVQTLARQTRALVLELVPGAEESVDGSGPYIGYGYGPGYKDLICTIILSKAGVKLGLAGGATLPDPKGLLEGSGKVHRHIVVKTADDLRKPGVRPLVRAALTAWQKRRLA
jgi:hypothetical protein